MAAQQNLECAKVQHNYYRECVTSSKQNIVDADKLSILSLSYSFDHAQQFHYPSNR